LFSILIYIKNVTYKKLFLWKPNIAQYILVNIKEQCLFKMGYEFMATFAQFNVSLLNISIHFFKTKSD